MDKAKRAKAFALAGLMCVTACATVDTRAEQSCLNPAHNEPDPNASFFQRLWDWAFGPACGSSDFYAGLAAHDRGDYQTARDVWERQADQGLARSQFHLATMYGAGQGGEPDQDKAKLLFAAATAQGYNGRHYALTEQEGHAVAAETPWYEAVALAQTTATPSATARPRPKPAGDLAFESLARSQESGDRPVAIAVPIARPTPDATETTWDSEPTRPPTPTLAAATRAPVPSDRPAPAAAFETGMTAYMRGNYRNALRYWNALAHAGDERAQTWIGIMHENGQGVPRDHDAAAKWYQLAADQGYAEAQFSLAVSYERGLGVLTDHQTAAGWYQRAAEQGHTDAQYRLGLMYMNGRGVASDLKLAHVWFGFAAEEGDTIAQESKDLVILGMTPAELAEAEALSARLRQRIIADQ